MKRYREGSSLQVIIALILASFFLAGSSSCKSQKEAAGTGLSKNSPPQVASVRILPENPNRESVFTLIIESYDKDFDRVRYRYQWLRNDEEIDGEDKEMLRGILLKKGDTIRVKVTPSDGKTEGDTVVSPAVKVVDSPPAIKEVRIEPKIAYANDALKAVVKSYDADGDSVPYTYKWEKNGVSLSEDNAETLARDRFKKGDSIAVTVFPNEGGTLGTPKRSESIMIANSPPIITSSPPHKTDGNTYTYQVEANDPDNDAVIFALRTAPKGMEINKETGLIRWEIRKGDQGTQAIEIEASDSEGAKCFQRYTLAIEIK